METLRICLLHRICSWFTEAYRKCKRQTESDGEMLLNQRNFNRNPKFFCRTALALGLSVAVLSGCGSGGQIHGYVLDVQMLDLIPPGSSKEQVLLSLGTPTTQGDYGDEAFYYITQKRSKGAEFMKERVVDQSILAVYFDKDETVSRVANYTLADGRAFDTISRTTPTGGKEETFLTRVLSSVGTSGKGTAAKGLFGG